MASVYKSGKGFCAQVRRKGFPSKTKRFPRKADATRWASEVEKQMIQGAFEYLPADDVTMAKALDRYLTEVSPNKAPSTHKGEIRMAKVITAKLGNFTLPHVTGPVLAHYRNARLKTMSPYTVRMELAMLSHLFSTAMKEWGMGLPSNPVSRISQPKLPKGRDRVLTEEEQEKFLNVCDGRRSPLLGWFVRVALATAMRKTEILTLRKNQVDIKKRVVLLPKTKNGMARSIPLTQNVTEVFRRILAYAKRPKDVDLLFFGSRGQGRARCPYALDTPWKNALKKAEITGLRVHDLRHTAISRMVELGLNDTGIASISGHSSIRMLFRYTHLRSAKLVQRLDTLEPHS